MIARSSGVKHTVEFSGEVSEEPHGCALRVPTLTAVKALVEVSFDDLTLVRPSLTTVALAMKGASSGLVSSSSLEALSKQEVECDAIIASLDACALAVNQQNMDVLLDAHADFCDQVSALDNSVRAFSSTSEDDNRLRKASVVATVRYLHDHAHMLLSPYPSLTAAYNDPLAHKSYKLLSATETHFTRGETPPPLQSGLLRNYRGLLQTMQAMVKDHNTASERTNSIQTRAAAGNVGSMGAQASPGAGKYKWGRQGPLPQT